MKMTPRLQQAVCIAAMAHRNQTRKGSEIPFIIHPFSVMCIASQVTDDEDVLIACLFHDILEDVPEEYPKENMRREFGDLVVETVEGVTKDESIPDWHDRCRAYLDHLEHRANNGAVVVCAADKIHNMMAVLHDYNELGEALWQRFTTNSGPDQLWWYQSVE